MANLSDYAIQWHDLIRRTEQALDGKAGSGIKVENGFRVNRWDGKQLIAVYWGKNKEGHRIEIAVSPKLPVGELLYYEVENWVEHEISASGRRGEEHKMSDPWPTMGFEKLEHAYEFLELYKKVREGKVSRTELLSKAVSSGMQTPAHVDHAPVVETGKSHTENQLSAAELLAAFRRKTGGAPGSTVAERKTMQRIGQTLLRRALMEIWGGCCSLTSLSVPRLLRASHIKPWSQSSETERLDPANCLLLAPHVDGAFDLGFISFDAVGSILLSPELTSENIQHLALIPKSELRLRPSQAQQEYLAWHRQHKFRNHGLPPL